jgi:hypothetical protein
MRTSATADVRWRSGMTPHMIRICGSTFHFIAGRSREPTVAAAMGNLGKGIAAGNDMPPANQKKQPTYKEH